MKRGAPGTYSTYNTATKGYRKGSRPKRVKLTGGGPQRAGYGSVARTRGAAVTGEMKYFDCDRTSTAIVAVTTTWPAGTILDPLTTINLGAAAVATPQNICSPVVGAALNQRVGRKISIHKIKVTGTFFVGVQTAQAAADQSCKIRWLLVQDQQTNAAQMTSAQLLQDATGADTTISTYQNPNNFGRFRVLKDKMLFVDNLNLTGDPTAGNVIQAGWRRNFKCQITFKTPINVHFNATNGGTVADIVDNSFHLIFGTDNAAYVPQVNYYTRVCYKDV